MGHNLLPNTNRRNTAVVVWLAAATVAVAGCSNAPGQAASPNTADPGSGATAAAQASGTPKQAQTAIDLPAADDQQSADKPGSGGADGPQGPGGDADNPEPDATPIDLPRAEDQADDGAADDSQAGEGSAGDGQGDDNRDSGDRITKEHLAAAAKATDYATTMHMSKARLFDQLTAEVGDNLPTHLAQYAVDNARVDWKANALTKAKMYQEQMNLPPNAIRAQLTSEHGEKFTDAEADYAVTNLP